MICSTNKFVIFQILDNLISDTSGNQTRNFFTICTLAHLEFKNLNLKFAWKMKQVVDGIYSDQFFLRKYKQEC